MSWVSSFMGGDSGFSNPADAGMPYLEKVPGYVDQYMNPYINMGQEAGNIAQQQYAQMAGDPTQYYNDIYDQYDVSPYAEFQQDQMTEAAGNSAAAGGFAGTESDIQKQSELTNAILSQDWQQYLQQILGIQGMGLNGEQQMYQTGYGASSQALNTNAQNATQEAGMAYGGQQSQNSYNAATANGLMSSLFGAAGLGAYLYGL